MIDFSTTSAKSLTLVAYDPSCLLVHSELYSHTDIVTLDASELCRKGEKVAFWELMARAQAMDMVLLGYIFLPSAFDSPLHSAINPMGNKMRSKAHMWNTGDLSHKFVVLRNRNPEHYRAAMNTVDEFVTESNTEKASWVVAAQHILSTQGSMSSGDSDD
eukprot:gene5401-5624_t